MLFCSLDYLWFFSLIFAVYWLLPWPAARLAAARAPASTSTPSWNEWLALLICVTTTVRLPARPRHGRHAIAAPAQVAPDRQHRRQPRRCCATSSTPTSSSTRSKTPPAAAGHRGVAARPERHPAGRHLVLHLRGDQLHGRRLPRPDPGRAETSATSCCSSCSSRTWSPGRSCGPRDFLPQITRPQALELGPRAGRGAALPAGAVQEAGHRRPHGPVRRPGLRRPGRATARRPCWLAVLAYALQIYCDFSGYSDMALGSAHLLGYKLAHQLQHAVPRPQHRRVLAALAHLALDLAARLPVHPAGRQPRRPLADLPQPDDHDDAGRPVARGELDLRPLGRLHGRICSSATAFIGT